MRDRRSPVRIMTWNLSRGGRGGPTPPATPRQLADLVADVEPDVLCCTETYGAADELAAALGYRGYRLSEPHNDDNLAIVTRLPVVERFGHPVGRTVDSYNLGGLRLALPGGRRFSVLDVWLRFDLGMVEALETTARQVAEGRRRSYSDTDLARLELPQLTNVEEILADHLPAVAPDESEPVLLAGGLNTESHLDWAATELPARHGITPDWQVTQALAKAGFLDAYRVAEPDPESAPGSTCNPLDEDQRMPHRIDYVFARGSGIEVAGARTVDERLPAHGPGPFYSDHAALVVDLLITDPAA